MVVDSAVTGGPHEEKLIDDILHNRNYTALARPVAEESEALVVSFGLSLQQIIKIVSAAGSAEARSPRGCSPKKEVGTPETRLRQRF